MAVWPTNPAEWRAAFAQGTGADELDVAARLAAGDLDAAPFLRWIEREFAASGGFHDDFVPALSRNIHGLLTWAYADGTEPYWPGTDV